MNTMLNDFGLSITVFITQKCDTHVAKHTNNILIIRKGKSKVSKTVKKNICETESTAINRITAEIRKLFSSLVIGLYLKKRLRKNIQIFNMIVFFLIFFESNEFIYTFVV